jgi:hypothetical protein
MHPILDVDIGMYSGKLTYVIVYLLLPPSLLYPK